MIRVNLLPRSMRRRRLALRRETVTLASMLLGWALVMSLGYFWIAAHGARAAALRLETASTQAETERVRKRLDNGGLAERQKQLRAGRQALVQLQGERRTPLAALEELAELVDMPGGSPFGAPADAPLRLLELRTSPPATWRLVGTARDAAALAGLVLRLGASARFDLVYGPEYAREAEGRLRFRVDLAVGRWD